MKAQYLETGRFQYPTIWINEFKPLGYYPYPTDGDNMMALTIGQALDLWKELTIGLVEAGQAGTLDAGIKEFVLSKV